MAKCEDFKITLRNSTHGEIRAAKFEYKDGSKWRTENMFGPDGHQEIEEGHSVAFTRDLEGIGNESTRFKVAYRYNIGGT